MTLARLIGGFELPENYINGIINEICVVAYACMANFSIGPSAKMSLNYMILIATNLGKMMIPFRTSQNRLRGIDGQSTNTMISEDFPQD